MLVVVVRSKNESRSFEFDQPVITIGRADVNDIVLPTPKVSKRHARLELSAQGLVLSDLKSTNGTYVNGRKVLSPVLVAEGDRVHVGEFTLELQASTGVPSGLAPAGFTAVAQASADTEPQSGNSSSASTGTNEDPGTRRGAAYRLTWLDDWLSSGGPGSPMGKLAGQKPRSSIDGMRRESSLPFTVWASLPGVVTLGQSAVLRIWADARSNSKEASSRQRAAALEVYVSLPDGKVEAFQADQGMLWGLLGGQSAELVLPLRGRDLGQGRVEIAICHRGARLCTLTLRPEVRGNGHTTSTPNLEEELARRSDLQVSAAIESVLPDCAPRAVLRVREYGPLSDTAASEPQPSLSGSHSSESSRRRRLKVELSLVQEESSEVLGAGEILLETPLVDRLRAVVGGPEADRVASAAEPAREAALQAFGESLAQTLLPPAVREALGSLSPGTFLQIDCPEVWAPWEIVRVSKGLASHYLAERFALTRSGSGCYAGRFATTPRMLISPPGVESLAKKEQQALALLDVRLRQLHRLADVQPLFQQPGVAGWHITGHGAFDRGDKSAAPLRLEDGVLTPVQIVPALRFRKSNQTPPFSGSFVLLCASEPTPPSAPLSPAGTAQWVERFLAAGVGAIVATAWPVSSSKAGQFAEVFYRAWSNNRPLAVAVAEARESIRSDGDPAWMSFTVYGLPGARLGGV